NTGRHIRGNNIHCPGKSVDIGDGNGAACAAALVHGDARCGLYSQAEAWSGCAISQRGLGGSRCYTVITLRKRTRRQIDSPTPDGVGNLVQTGVVQKRSHRERSIRRIILALKYVVDFEHSAETPIEDLAICGCIA